MHSRSRLGVKSGDADRIDSLPDNRPVYLKKRTRLAETAGVISALIRCTVPVPTPSVVAILRIPTSPFLSALRIAASVAVLMVGRPSVLAVDGRSTPVNGPRSARPGGVRVGP
jgi:hypothetical protein